MKGYFGVFLLVACLFSVLGRISADPLKDDDPELPENCAVLVHGKTAPLTEIDHENLDGTQNLRVHLPNELRLGATIVGSKLVVCDDEGKPELKLTNDESSVLIKRTKSNNKHGYIQLTTYVHMIVKPTNVDQSYV